jgi:hypothetical protein
VLLLLPGTLLSVVLELLLLAGVSVKLLLSSSCATLHVMLRTIHSLSDGSSASNVKPLPPSLQRDDCKKSMQMRCEKSQQRLVSKGVATKHAKA